MVQSEKCYHDGRKKSSFFHISDVTKRCQLIEYITPIARRSNDPDHTLLKNRGQRWLLGLWYIFLRGSVLQASAEINNMLNETNVVEIGVRMQKMCWLMMGQMLSTMV